MHPDHPRAPLGVTLDPAEASIVGEIFAAYLEPGASLYSLVRTLHAQHVPSPTGQPWWGLATLRGILTNPTYTGQVYAGRMHYRAPQVRRSATHAIGRPHDSAVLQPPAKWIPVATVPAVVTDEQFALVQHKLAQNQSFASRHNTVNTYLLRALVSCGHCHHSCSARTVGHRQLSYYICVGKAKATQSHRE